MKRNFQTIFALSLILVSFLTFNQRAIASVTSPPVQVNGYKGDALEIPIQLTATAAVAGINGELNFDPNLFGNPVVNTGPGASDFTVRQGVSSSGVLRFVVYPSPLNTLKLDTVILKVSLTVVTGLTEDVDTTLTYTNVAASDVDAHTMSDVSFSTVTAHLRASGAPEVPRNPSPVDDAASVEISSNLSWSASAGAESYQVFLWKTAESKPQVPTVSALSTPQYDPPTDLEYDTPYSWQVVAVNVDGETEGAVWTFTTVHDPGEKYSVTVVADPVVGGTVSKTPDRASYTTGTVVTLTATGNAGWKFVGWYDGATMIAETSSFEYIVIAENKIFTAQFRVLPTMLPAPENVTATVDASSYLVKVTWNAVPDATHYQVLRAVGDKTPQSVAFDEWIEGTSFADDSVVPGVSYEYSVKASINAGEFASDASTTVTGRAKADPSVVASNFKVTYKKGMQLQKVVAGGVADLNFAVAGVTNGTIKIARLKKLPSATADDPAKGIAYLLNVTEITNLAIAGDVKTLWVDAPVYNLASSGLIKALTATSEVGNLTFKEAGTVKLSATKDSSVPYFARTRITGGVGVTPVSILSTGVVLEGLSIPQPVKMVKAAAKAYKTAALVKTSSLGAIGLAQDLDSKAGVVSQYNANGPSWMTLGGVSGVTKTLLSVTGGSIVVDSLNGFLDKIMVTGGDVQCWEILSNSEIRLLQAKAKKVLGVPVGGRLGALNNPGALTVWAKTNFGSIVGDSGISGRFVAGYAFANEVYSANYSGAIKLISAKTGSKIEGHADMSAALQAKLKFSPKTPPPATQFAIHTAAGQEPQ